MDLPPRPVRNLSKAQQEQQQRLVRRSLIMRSGNSIRSSILNTNNTNNTSSVKNNNILGGDYCYETFHNVVDAIFKLGMEDEHCFSWSDSSLTIPETVATNDFENATTTTPTSTSTATNNSSNHNAHLPFQLCGHYYATEKEQQEAELVYLKRNNNDQEHDDGDGDDDDDANHIDDEISVSSDCVPLGMTDDDAIDEIDFTRGLMGYQEGFDDFNSSVTRILEEEGEEEDREDRYQKRIDTPKPLKIQANPTFKGPGGGTVPAGGGISGRIKRPPLRMGKPPCHTPTTPAPKAGHRRTHSGGSSTPMSKLFAHHPAVDSRMISPPTAAKNPSHRRAHSRDSADLSKRRSPLPSTSLLLPHTTPTKTKLVQNRQDSPTDTVPLLEEHDSQNTMMKSRSHQRHRRTNSNESTTPVHVIVSGTNTTPTATTTGIQSMEKKRMFLRFPRSYYNTNITNDTNNNLNISMPPTIPAQRCSSGSKVVSCTICGRLYPDGTLCACGMREV